MKLFRNWSADRRWAMLVPVVLALALHWAVILGRGFDGLYGQDAFAYYRYTLQLRESVAQHRLPPPFFWPIGYPAMVMVAFAIADISPLAGQLVSSLAGVGVVLLVSLLARDLMLSGKEDRRRLPFGWRRSPA